MKKWQRKFIVVPEDLADFVRAHVVVIDISVSWVFMTPVTCRTQQPRPPTAHCVVFPFPVTPYHRDTVTPSPVGVSDPSVRDEGPPTGRLGWV